ncbi:hypothetical protein [Nonomuraea sp. NPDC049400]|uniref:hypothetical protein n=1 Tax=Nonomuraea sp. NPDC049400 TaxID=3364352 RepID=UPI003796C1ED
MPSTPLTLKPFAPSSSACPGQIDLARVGLLVGDAAHGRRRDLPLVAALPFLVSENPRSRLVGALPALGIDTGRRGVRRAGEFLDASGCPGRYRRQHAAGVLGRFVPLFRAQLRSLLAAMFSCRVVLRAGGRSREAALVGWCARLARGQAPGAQTASQEKSRQLGWVRSAEVSAPGLTVRRVGDRELQVLGGPASGVEGLYQRRKVIERARVSSSLSGSRKQGLRGAWPAPAARSDRGVVAGVD